MKNLVFKIGEELWVKPGQGIATSGFKSIGHLISTLLPNIYILAGVILFFLLIGGGLVFIVNAGRDNPEAAAKGKQAVTAALIGFLIVFASYWIIQIVQAVTGLAILEGEG